MALIQTTDGLSLDPDSIVRVEFHDSPAALVGEVATVFVSGGKPASAAVDSIASLGALRSLVTDTAEGFSLEGLPVDRPEVYIRTGPPTG